MSAFDRLPDRAGAVNALLLVWYCVLSASAHVQQLDEPIVRYATWGDEYALAQEQLDAGVGLTESWPRSPYPAEAAELDRIRGIVRSDLRAAQYDLKHFEWSKTQGRLFDAGRTVLAAAESMGVEL